MAGCRRDWVGCTYGGRALFELGIITDVAPQPALTLNPTHSRNGDDVIFTTSDNIGELSLIL